MASIFAVLAELKDARAGKPAYFWALTSDPASHPLLYDMDTRCLVQTKEQSPDHVGYRNESDMIIS